MLTREDIEAIEFIESPSQAYADEFDGIGKWGLSEIKRLALLGLAVRETRLAAGDFEQLSRDYSAGTAGRAAFQALAKALRENEPAPKE